MYYKLVTEYSFFTDLYPGMDILNIPQNTVFTAPTTSKHKPDNPECMVGLSHLHFADGAMDIMLWHTRLSHFNMYKNQIYAVQPVGNVIKKRCIDSLGIYQCGAHQIKFLEKQNLDELYDLAVREYYTFPTRYTNFDINLDCWGKHKTTAFFLKKSYEDSLPKKQYLSVPIDKMLAELTNGL